METRAATSRPAAHSNEHFRYFDALRGIAILLTLIIHNALMTHQLGLIYKVAFMGQKGVQLFYIISAFMLCQSFHVRGEDEKYLLRNYFVRRFFRIAPLFYAAIIFNLFVSGLRPRPEAPGGLTPWDILLGFLFLNGFRTHTVNSIVPAGWSIAVETSFYVVLPVLLLWTRTTGRALALLLVSAAAATAWAHFGGRYFASLTDDQRREFIRFLSFPVQVPVFCMGIYCYFLWKNTIQGRKIAQAREISVALLVASMLIAGTSFPSADYKLYWASSAFIPLLLALALHEWKFLVNGFTVFLGKISYSVYLTHLFVLMGLRHLWHFIGGEKLFHAGGNHAVFALTFLLDLALSVGVSMLTFRFIEKPGIRLGRKLIESWEHKAVPGRL